MSDPTWRAAETPKMTRVYFITGTIVFPNEMNLHQPPWQYKSHKKELNESQKCEKPRELREENEATADECDHRRVKITDWKTWFFEFTTSCIPKRCECGEHNAESQSECARVHRCLWMDFIELISSLICAAGKHYSARLCVLQTERT